MGQSLNVAHLEEAYEDDVCVDLVMELAAGGNMWQRIKRGSYSEATAARCVRGACRQGRRAPWGGGGGDAGDAAR
jgi:hypothetical protein